MTRHDAHTIAGSMASLVGLSDDAAAALEMMLSMSDGSGFTVGRLVNALDELGDNHLVKFQIGPEGALPGVIVFDAPFVVGEEMELRSSRGGDLTLEQVIARLVVGLGLSTAASDLLIAIATRQFNGGRVEVLPVGDGQLDALAELERHCLLDTDAKPLLSLDTEVCIRRAAASKAGDE